MRIASIALKIPSLSISNQQVLDFVSFYNPDQPAELVAAYQRELAFLLRRSGSEQRFFRDRDRKETAIDLIVAAAGEAIAEAGLGRDDIDLLIYCGVGKGFVEPANAYFCAEALGMNCSCFDISDACMSWVRSLEVAQAMMAAGGYRNILIVNGEFTAYEYGFPDVYRIRNPGQLSYSFPAYTIGEAATGTVVSADAQSWTFNFRSLPALASLCSIPLEGYRDFCASTTNIGLNGINGFVSFGGALFDAAVDNMVQLVRETVTDTAAPDIWFPHGAAIEPCRRAGEILGLDMNRVYLKGFPVYGNLVSASIPAAMCKAKAEGSLRRGMRVVLTPASAGMSFCVAEFIY